MFDGNVLHLAISLVVACTVVLQLDNDTAQLAICNVENVPDDGSVPALSPYVPNQDNQPAAGFQGRITPLEADHQQFTELLIAFAIAQVTWTVTVLYDVPVRGVYPDKVELARKVVSGQIKTFL
jgi:hypothetical protein